jgi:hypothetical protein
MKQGLSGLAEGTVNRSPQVDIVYLHGEAALIGPSWLERLAHWRNPQFVHDFDDATWCPTLALANDTSLTSSWPARPKPSVEWRLP